MKHLLTFATLLVSLTSSHAGTQLNCESENFTLSLIYTKKLEITSANYGINKQMNEGADVTVTGAYLSNEIIAARFQVDGRNLFELSASRNPKTNAFDGRVFLRDEKNKKAKLLTQNAICTHQFAVTPDERSDDEDVSR